MICIARYKGYQHYVAGGEIGVVGCLDRVETAHHCVVHHVIGVFWVVVARGVCRKVSLTYGLGVVMCVAV